MLALFSDVNGVKHGGDVSTLLASARRADNGTVSLQPGDGAVLGSYPVEPCRHAGIDPDDPGNVPWVYDREEQLLIIDLGSESR